MDKIEEEHNRIKNTYRDFLTKERLEKAIRYWKYNPDKYWGLCAYFKETYDIDTGNAIWIYLLEKEVISHKKMYLAVPMKREPRVEMLKQILTDLYEDE